MSFWSAMPSRPGYRKTLLSYCEHWLLPCLGLLPWVLQHGQTTPCYPVTEQFTSINIWPESRESVPLLRKAILGEGLSLQLWNSTFSLLLTLTYSTLILLKKKKKKKKNLKSRIHCLAFTKNDHTLGIKPIDISITHHKGNPQRQTLKLM